MDDDPVPIYLSLFFLLVNQCVVCVPEYNVGLALTVTLSASLSDSYRVLFLLKDSKGKVSLDAATAAAAAAAAVLGDDRTKSSCLSRVNE